MDGPIPPLLTALAADPYLVTASTAPQALMAEVLEAAGLREPRPIQLVHPPRLAVDHGRLLALTEHTAHRPPLFPADDDGLEQAQEQNQFYADILSSMEE